MRTVLTVLALLWRLHLVLADVALTGGTVIAFNPTTQELEVLPNTTVHVVGDTIVGLHSATSGFVPPRGTTVLDVSGDIVSPGFIDTHRHLWQTAFRTIASNTTLPEYFIRFGAQTNTQRVFKAEDVYIGQLAGLYESLNSGVTTVVDHAHHTWSVAATGAGLQGSIDSGLRVFWCPAVQTLTNGFTTAQQMTAIHDLFTAGSWKGTTTRIGLAFDEVQEPLTQVDTDVFKLAKELDAPVFTIHYLGGPWGGDGLPQALNRLGFLNGSIPVIFSHGNFISTTDMNVLRDTNQYLSITPESEMHYVMDHLGSHLIMDQAALGIDTHATFSADIVGQARIWLQSARLRAVRPELLSARVVANSPMSARQAFALATRHGGLALRRDDLGVIRVGAKADLVVFDGASPNMLGWADPFAAIILHSHVSDVRHVLVGGEFRKRDGRIVHGDWSAVKARFMRSRNRIQGIWAQMNFPPFAMGQFRQDAGSAVVIPNLDAQRGNGTGY